MPMHNPPHPGEVLQEFLPAGVSVTEAAGRIGVSRQLLSAILNGRAGISADMAMRLSMALGTSAESWLGMQMQYDLWHARQNPPKGVRRLAARSEKNSKPAPTPKARGTKRPGGQPMSDRPNPQLKSNSPDSDMQGVAAALLRAGRRAREIARQTGTAVVFMRDGELVEERYTPEVEPKSGSKSRLRAKPA